MFRFNIPDLNKQRPEGGNDCQGRKERNADFARLSSHLSAALMCLRVRVHVRSVNHMMTFLLFLYLRTTVCAGQADSSETLWCHMQSARLSPQAEHVQDEHLT